jgi:hypothetical protein
MDNAQAQLFTVADRMWQAAEAHMQQHEMQVKLYPPADHPCFVADVNSGPALWMQWAAQIQVRQATGSHSMPCCCYTSFLQQLAVTSGCCCTCAE